jgi:hypothetical protein
MKNPIGNTPDREWSLCSTNESRNQARLPGCPFWMVVVAIPP